MFLTAGQNWGKTLQTTPFRKEEEIQGAYSIHETVANEDMLYKKSGGGSGKREKQGERRKEEGRRLGRRESGRKET